MLWLSLSVKLVCEVALLAALGRWLLGRLIGPGARETNPFHRLLDWMVRPFERAFGRWVVPALLGLWLLATAAKVALCLGSAACR
jgi:hypothetical protein